MGEKEERIISTRFPTNHETENDLRKFLADLRTHFDKNGKEKLSLRERRALRNKQNPPRDFPKFEIPNIYEALALIKLVQYPRRSHPVNSS